MAFSIDTWLAEVTADGTLTPEERKQAQALLAKDPKVVKKLQEQHEGNLRQSDYSRNMEALKKKENDTAELIKANTTWKQDAEKKLNQATKDLESERTTRAQYEAKIRTIATEYGLDEKELLPAATAPVVTPTTKTEPNVDYVSREVFDKTADISMRLPAAIADLAADHLELFGKPLRGASALVAKAFESGKPLRTVWEEEHQVQNRRDTLTREADEKREKDIRADERSKILSETSLPVSRPGAPRSPIFTTVKPSGNVTNPGGGVAAAVRDFNQRLGA